MHLKINLMLLKFARNKSLFALISGDKSNACYPLFGSIFALLKAAIFSYIAL